MSAELARQRYEEERVAALHFEYVLRKQQVAAGRWAELCRLRAMEVCDNKSGLVFKFEEHMRMLDRRLAANGIWIGSYTRRILKDPVLGDIPQLPVDYQLPAEDTVIDLT